MVNSRAKGARNELKWAGWLKENLGINARRGQQYCGGPDSPDVVSDLPIFWEVKAVESLNVQKAMAQAVADCGENDTPAVAHKKNRTEWLITIRAKDLLRFTDAIVGRNRK